MPKYLNNNSSGSVIVSILFVSLFLTTILYALIVLASSNLVRAKSRIFLLQAQYASESGADAAIAILNSGNDTYAGSATEVNVLSNSQYKATYTVNVASGTTSKERIVTAVGKVYAPANSPTANYSRTIKIVAQRSSSTTTSSVVSRNILNIESGVKSLTATDLYINGYIVLNKNTTNLISENITVADKNTGATNCSIGGSGNLVKPSAFTHAGQTKTNLILGFNNCLSPPGNTSNSNFTVAVNQTNITKIQSTFIPWSQYMDSSYQNSPGGCSDWTSGSFPRNIPSTGNTKKTHYPDTGSNISTSCGTSGDLSLTSGQYTIRDNVHLRANLCASSGCSPTFYNPDPGVAGIKYIFVEGSINFSSIQTANGSGPIVMIAYGTDPASLTASCPLGGAIHLANSGTSSAPAIYFLAVNGICLDKTKFSSANALGGLSGKNIYIASNPGTPFDLGLDPNFPSSAIPIDLAWRATMYQRL